MVFEYDGPYQEQLDSLYGYEGPHQEQLNSPYGYERLHQEQLNSPYGYERPHQEQLKHAYGYEGLRIGTGNTAGRCANLPMHLNDALAYVFVKLFEFWRDAFEHFQMLLHHLGIVALGWAGL